MYAHYVHFLNANTIQYRYIVRTMNTKKQEENIILILIPDPIRSSERRQAEFGSRIQLSFALDYGLFHLCLSYFTLAPHTHTFALCSGFGLLTHCLQSLTSPWILESYFSWTGSVHLLLSHFPAVHCCSLSGNPSTIVLLCAQDEADNKNFFEGHKHHFVTHAHSTIFRIRLTLAMGLGI